MSNDPLHHYRSMMSEIEAPAHLTEDVMGRIREQAMSQPASPALQQSTSQAKSHAATRSAQATQRKKPPAIRKRKKPLTGFAKRAIAACLAAAVILAGSTFALSTFTTADNATSSLVIKAYGGQVSDTFLPSGNSDTIVFNCETETQRFVSPDSETYTREGFYTGCVFRVEGDNIARIQANVSRGELYRVTSMEYTMQSNPELAQEVASWKGSSSIGKGEILGKYDYVAPVLFYEYIDEDDANADKLGSDPSAVHKVNLYQRLGQTIDVESTDEPETPMSEYAFGLWTNESFNATEPNPDNVTTCEQDNLNAALDTLDGAQLTITVTYDDGSQTTQVIDLSSADFKANVITVLNGLNTTLELVPQIVAADDDEYRARVLEENSGVGIIHTLYGTLDNSNNEAFPCGEASYENLTEPLTPAYEPAAPEQVDAESTDRTGPQPGPDIRKSDVSDLGMSYDAEHGWVVDESGNYVSVADAGAATISVDRVYRADSLPEGVQITDMLDYYEAGGFYDSALDHLYNEYAGYTISADGTLSEGFSYVVVEKTVTNNTNQLIEVQFADGEFITLQENPSNKDMWSSTYPYWGTDMIWRSGHDEPGWDTHVLFETLEPHETRTFQLFYVLPSDVLDDPLLAYSSGSYYEGSAEEWTWRERVALVGPLA